MFILNVVISLILAKNVNLLCCGWHWTNALPIIPAGQLHIGTWLMTSQMAFRAHVPGHGSTHLLLRQALSLGQSEFRTHSGRQPE